MKSKSQMFNSKTSAITPHTLISTQPNILAHIQENDELNNSSKNDL